MTDETGAPAARPDDGHEPEERRGPTLTAGALDHLAGRSLILRAERRNGCCGGHAIVPVADVGPPTVPERYTAVTGHDEVVCYIDPLLLDVAAEGRVDAVGIGRWRRLYLEGIDLAQDHPGAEGPPDASV